RTSSRTVIEASSATVPRLARIVPDGADATARGGGFAQVAPPGTTSLHRNAAHGGVVEQRSVDPTHAQEARADMRSDDGPDLSDEGGFGPEDLSSPCHELVGLLAGLDVLDDPRVGAVVVAAAHVVHHPLERPSRRADALDRRDLGLDREDGLDLQ